LQHVATKTSIAAIQKSVRAQLRELAPAGKADLGVAVIKEVSAAASFDLESFVAAHPDLHSQYQIQSIKGTFSLKKPKAQLAELLVDEPLEAEGLISKDIANLGDKDLLIVDRIATSLLEPSDWDYRLGEAELKAAAGHAAEVPGVFSWKREIQSNFDAKAFKAEHPELHEKFLVRGEAGKKMVLNQEGL
jgi:hypothetical protein